MERESSLPSSQQRNTGLYPDPDKSKINNLIPLI